MVTASDWTTISCWCKSHLRLRSSSHSAGINQSGLQWECCPSWWARLSEWLGPNDLCKMHPSGGSIVDDACQQNPGWGHSDMCVACGLLNYPMLLEVHLADIMYLKLSYTQLLTLCSRQKCLGNSRASHISYGWWFWPLVACPKGKGCWCGCQYTCHNSGDHLILLIKGYPGARSWSLLTYAGLMAGDQHGSSRRETISFPWLSTKAFYTISACISLGLNSQNPVKTFTPLTLET